MSTRFFTNSGDNPLLNKFMGIFENNKDISTQEAEIDLLVSELYRLPEEETALMGEKK